MSQASRTCSDCADTARSTLAKTRVRTFAWLTTNRRLAKDYERFVETGEMLLYLAMSRILLRRLTRKER